VFSITALIITYNEERNIGRCIQSLQGVADEILVIDSFSTDRTKEICASYNVRFVENKWINYSEQKNFGQKLASNDYMLSLDADEALSEKLATSIKEIKNSNSFYLYSFKRLTNYCGKWIRHGGWYPDKKTRLYDRRTGHWTGSIHETLVVPEGLKPILLQGDCLHYSYYSVEHHRQKAELFASLMAKEAIAKGKKASQLHLLFKPSFKFISNYFLRLGLLDGYYGFIIAKISAHVTYLKYLKMLDAKQAA
jgi:glycosyltransferase involved in cell wall biosynthesis